MKKNVIVFSRFFLIIPFLLLGCTSTHSRKASGMAATAPATSPQHFWFDYPYQPLPGKRYWTAVGKMWIEQYESGDYSRFLVVCRTNLLGTAGTLLVKVEGEPDRTQCGNDNNFNAFIPDRNSREMQFWFRRKDNGIWSDWRALADMKGVE